MGFCCAGGVADECALTGAHSFRRTSLTLVLTRSQPISAARQTAGVLPKRRKWRGRAAAAPQNLEFYLQQLSPAALSSDSLQRLFPATPSSGFLQRLSPAALSSSSFQRLSPAALSPAALCSGSFQRLFPAILSSGRVQNRHF